MEHHTSFGAKGNIRQSVALLLACGLALLALAAFGVMVAIPVEGVSALPLLDSLNGIGLPRHEVATTADIAISQEGPKQNIVPGGVTSYTIHVVNNGGSAVSDMTLLDTWSVKMTEPSISTMWPYGILPEFQTYTVSPPNAVTYFTHTVNNTYKRGEATWDLASLSAGGSVDIIFTLTIPITTQPTLDNYEKPQSLPSSVKTVGPTLLDNSVEVKVGTETPIPADPWTSVYIAAPLLNVTMVAVGETAGIDHCRIGRLVTYTIAVENVITYSRDVRPDGLPATNLVISNSIPAQIQGQVINTEAVVPGVTIDKQDTYISWVFPPTFVLTRGETTVMTFTARVPIDTPYYPGAEYLVTKADSLRRVYKLFAHADGMPFRDASLEDDHEVRILSPFDKVVKATYPPSGDAKTYPNRMITYTLTFYNPSHLVDVSDWRIEDKLYETFTYSETLAGNFSSPQISGTLLIWDNLGVEANGAISTIFSVHVGPQTPVEEGYSCGLEYPNSVTATTSILSPTMYIGHYYGSFGSKRQNELAPLDVEPQLDLSKDVDPKSQMPGEEVTYTVQIENDGDITIPMPIVITDLLPSGFEFSQMLAGPVSDPIIDGNMLGWHDVPTLTPNGTPSDTVQFSYRVVVDGVVGGRYYNTVYGYSPETSFCSDDVSVKILSPIGINKTAQPTQVVQGETFSYTAEIVNLNSRAVYTLTMFVDILDDPLSLNTGLINPVNGGLEYTYTLPADFRLEYGESPWTHTFDALMKGSGSCRGSSCWCDQRLSDPTKPIEQPEGHVGGIVYDENGDDASGANAEDLAPLYVRPHVSLIQQAYPNPVAIGEVVTIVLTLRDNRVDPITQVTGVHLQWTAPADFTVLSSDPPTSSQAGGDYFWNNIDVHTEEMVPTEGMTQFVLRVRAPWHREAGWYKRFAATAKVIALDQHSICIPSTNEFLVSDSGTKDPEGGELPWQFPDWGDEDLVRLEVNQGIEVDKEALGLGFGDKEVGPYNLVEYRLTIENLTGAPVSSVVITDILPSLQGESRWTYVETTAGFEPHGEDPPYWKLGMLPPETAVETNFTVRASAWLGGAFNDFEASGPINVGYSKNYTRNVMVTVVSGVGLFKEAEPDNIQAGDLTTYTITLYNGKSDDLEQVVITDTLPVGFAFDSMVSSSPDVGEPTVDESTLVWALPENVDIDKDGGKLEIIFRARTESEGMFSGRYYNHVDAFAINASTQDIVAMPPTGPTAPVYVDGLPTVEIDKAVTPGQIMAGDSVTYTITLYNEADTLRTLRITDTLPTDFMLAQAISPTTVVTTSVAGGREQLVWEGVDIGGQSWQTLTFRARTTWDISAGLLYYNAVQVGFDSFVLPEQPKLAPVQVVELPKGDIQVGKTDGRVVAEPGTTLDYTIAYTNASDELIFQSVVLTDTVETYERVDPSTYLVGSPTGWTDMGDGRYRRVIAGSLLPDQADTVNFSIELTGTMPSSVTLLYNTVEVGYVPVEASVKINTQDDIAQDTDFVGGDQPILAMKQSEPLSEVGAGELVTYTITLHNQDTQSHTLRVTDTLPLSFTWASDVSPPHDGTSLNETGTQQNVIWEDVLIDAGDTTYIVFRARVDPLAPASQGRCNTVQVERDGVAQEPVENQACLNVSPIKWVDVQVTKDDGQIRAEPGDNLFYTIRYVNGTTATSDLPLETVILTETVTPPEVVGAASWMSIPTGATTQKLGLGRYRLEIPGPLDPGAVGKVIFFVQIADPVSSTQMLNVVEAGHITEEPSLERDTESNEDDDTNAIILGGEDVTVMKEVTPRSIEAGGMVTYTITLINASSNGRNVRVTDTLPLYFELASVIYPPDYDSEWEDDRQKVIWGDISIGPGSETSIIYRVRANALAPSGQNYCNSVQIERDGIVQGGIPAEACVEVMRIYDIDVQISKSDGKRFAAPGDTLAYTIRYTNTAASELPLDSLILTEMITPSDVVEVLSSYWTPLGDGSYQYEIPGGLAVDSSGMVVFKVQVSDTVPSDMEIIRNRVAMTYTTSAPSIEDNKYDNVAEDEDRINLAGEEGAILVQKSVKPGYVVAGSYVTYTLVVANSTAFDQNDVAITDTLPASFEVDTATPDNFTTNNDGQQVVWRDISVLAGEEYVLTLRAKVDASASEGERCNAMQLAYGGTVQQDDAGVACVDVIKIKRVDAKISKDDGRRSVAPGQVVTYTLRYGNDATSELPLEDVTLTDVITPPDVVDEVISTGWTALGDGRYERQGESLLAGMTKQAQFVVRLVDPIPEGVEILQNRASIDYATREAAVDTNTANNTASDSDVVQQADDVLIWKDVVPTAVQTGGIVTYTITLTNPTTQAYDLHVEDTLPESFSLDVPISPTEVLTGSISGNQQVIWEDLNIAANGGTLELIFRAKVDPAAQEGEACNTVEVQRGSGSVSQGKVTPLACVNVSKVTTVDVQVAKDDGVSSFNAGDRLVYTIAYTNSATADQVSVHNIVLRDTISPTAYVTFDGGPGWHQDGDQYLYTHSATLAPGASGSVTIAFQVASEVADVQSIVNAVTLTYQPSEEAEELNPEDNRAQDVDTYAGSADFVDLSITDLSLSSTMLNPGDTLRISMTIQNSGTLAVEQDFYAAAYVRSLSAGPPTDADQAGLVCRSPFTDTLGAGAQEELACSTPVTQAQGTYMSYGMVDVTGVIDEDNETNNIRAGSTISVTTTTEGTTVYLPLILKQ